MLSFHPKEATDAEKTPLTATAEITDVLPRVQGPGEYDVIIAMHVADDFRECALRLHTDVLFFRANVPATQRVETGSITVARTP